MSRTSSSSLDMSGRSPQQIFNLGFLIFGVLVLLYLVFSGFYTVKEYEQAVVLRLGVYKATYGPGIHFKIPGIETVVLVDTSEVSMRLPSGKIEQGGMSDLTFGELADENEALILTGDLYAAIVEWNVIWHVEEPEKFVFSFSEEHIRHALLAVARSTMHRIVGDYSADEILTGKREEIAQAALREMRVAVEPFDAGITITDLQLQRVTPPDVVKPSFDQVNASIQQRDQSVNEARRERNGLIPMARANADKLIREAEGYASRRKAEAEGEISALLAKYESYRLSPEITRQRMYLETMEKIFSAGGKKIILDDQLKNMLPMLDLNK